MSFGDSNGNGYDVYSMSNNARDAYASGEKPLSKWTKAAILTEVEAIRPEAAEMLRNVPASLLKENVLCCSSWHHTSKMYNRTDFYSVDEDTIDELTAETVEAWRPTKKADNGRKYRGDFLYIEWEGTTRHPKAVEHRLENVNIEEKGSFYIVTDDDGKLLIRKKIGSNGTTATDYEDIRRREAEKAATEAMIAANSTEEAYELLQRLRSEGERSSSGAYYERGRKPSPHDYDMGLDKFYRVGEQRLVPKDEGGYAIEVWNGQNFSRKGE